MVRYTGPPSPTRQAKCGQPPLGIYQAKTGQWCDKNPQPSENKEVIWIVKAVFAVTDESDEGARPLIDMTKVTRSTLADKTLP
ncbi:hypothetical protein AE1304_03420 [Aeromonas enteropelogenes]